MKRAEQEFSTLHPHLDKDVDVRDWQLFLEGYKKALELTKYECALIDDCVGNPYVVAIRKLDE